MSDVQLAERIAFTQRPSGRAAGAQRWRSLSFLHWDVPADVLRPLLPARLTLDTFEGRAYVGLVPFTMRDVRPLSWAPGVPGARHFHETNVRTYVHLDGKAPGVWFFSLDAASALAVFAARTFWHLPYHRADMALSLEGPTASDSVGLPCATTGTRVVYRSTRTGPPPLPAQLDAHTDVGESLGAAEPGSLRYFLAERYVLYAERGGTLLSGRVHHAPYPLHAASVTLTEESLLAAGGIPTTGARTEALFSPGVDVEVFDLAAV